MRPRTALPNAASKRSFGDTSHKREVTALSKSEDSFVTDKRPISRPRTALNTHGSTGRDAATLPSKVYVHSRPMTAGLAQSDKERYSKETLSGRLVHDATYFDDLLSNKIRAIEHETEKLRTETVTLKRSLTTENELRALYHQTQEEVQELEALIYDFNMASETKRNGGDIDEIESTLLDMKNRNQHGADQLDELFLSNRFKQDEIIRIRKIVELKRESMLKTIENAETHDREHFEILNAQLKMLQNQEEELKLSIDSISHNIQEVDTKIENRVDRDIRAKYDQEIHLIKNIELELGQVEEDIRLAQMNDQDLNAHFIEKVKLEKSRFDKKSKELEDIDKLYLELNTIVDMKKNELILLKTEAESYDDNYLLEVFKKAQSARKYLTESQDRMRVVEDVIGEKQTKIVELLGELNSYNTESQLPSAERLNKIKSDSMFHSKELSNSKVTLEKLVEEKKRRSKELDYLLDLENKIEKEEKEIIDSITEMEKNLETFEDLEGIQARSKVDIKYLEELKERYQMDIYILDPKVTSISSKVQDMQNFLAGNQNYNLLMKLESEIVQLSETTFELKNLIRRQENEINYSGLKSHCLSLVKEFSANHEKIFEKRLIQ